MGCDLSNVTVFVANEEEKEIYEAAGVEPKIVVGVQGVVPQRRWYNAYYKAGTPILNVDDDVHDIQSVDANGKLATYEKSLDAVVEHGFETCEKYGLKNWGICPYANAFYMKPYTTIGLKFVCGIFAGSYAGDWSLCGSDRENLKPNAEDFETTIRAYKKYGGTVRLDWLCVVTKIFGPGGIQDECGGDEEIRYKQQTEACYDIAKRHKGFATPFEKAGYTSLRLTRMRSMKIPCPDRLLL